MTRREFHFEEGASRKFWAVSVSDSTMTVQFGRIGSAGQTQPKTFASPAAALAAAEKLIAEKTGKGYKEVGATPPAASPAPAPAKAAPAAPPAKAAPPTGAPERRLNLAPADWRRAGWRGRPEAVPLAKPRSFDIDALKAALTAGAGGWLEFIWDAAPPPDAVAPEEARLWFTAYTEWDRHASGRKKWIASLAPAQFAAPISAADLIAGFGTKWFDKLNLPILRLQRSYLKPADYIGVTCHHPMISSSAFNAQAEADWLEAHYYPHLSGKEMDAVRGVLRSRMKGEERVAAIAAILAGTAGMMADLKAYAEALKPEDYAKYRFNEEASAALFALDDPAEVERHFRRLGLLLRNPEEARAWLAHTEHSALDVVRDSALALHVDGLLKTLDVLMLAESPEAAAALMAVKAQTKNSKAVAKIAKWFDAHTAHAVAGLTPLAAERTKVGEAAAAWLADHARRTGAAPLAAPPAAPAKAAPRAEAAPRVELGGETSPRPPVAPPAPERRLNLSAEDRRAVAAPTGKPGPLPKPRAFDLEALKQRAIDYHHRNELPFDPNVPVTAQEARFWLIMHTKYQSMISYEREKAIKKAKAAEFDRPLTLADVKAAGEEMHYWNINIPTVQLQRAWLAPADLVEALASNQATRLDSQSAAGVASWLEAEVYPRLSAGDMEAVRERLRSLLKDDPAAAVLARHAGMAGDIAAWAAGLKKGGIAPGRMNAGFGVALFGIGDAAVMVREARRLGVRLATPADARSWLALTGHDGLDILRDSILAIRKAADQLAMLDVLLLAESPEAAVTLLELKLQAKPPEVAARVESWLKKHPGHAAAGLTPLSADSTPLGEAARSALGASSDAPASADWLQAGLAAVKPAKALPAFADPAVLPPIHGLGAEDVSRVLAALQASTLTGPHPLVSALRKGGDGAALAAFAWKLFEGWMAAGSPSKEKWALLSLGYFGDDGIVTKLTPLIRVWPGESQHQRAVTGLEVLRCIGSDTALTALNGMALKLKFKGLQDRARQLMDLIASDRGMTREQLEDRIVPDLGLDADGGRVFDFGPRRFRFTLSSDLTPELADESGKPLKDLPKPGAKDDAARAAEAAAAWKLLKAQLRDALKIQTFRLEEAMVTGRSWPVAEFTSLLVRHPFLTHLVRRLVWDGGEGRLFRVGDGGAFVNHDGRPVSGVETVRVAHRLRMTHGQVGSWRGCFDALDLEPPFPQLEREVFAPEGMAMATEFVRPAGRIPATKMRGTMEGRGWRRALHDHGGISAFVKPYAAAGVTAVVEIEPSILIGMMDNEDQTVEAVFFLAGTEPPPRGYAEGYYGGGARQRVGDVDAVAFSETVRDLMSLAPAGKG